MILAIGEILFDIFPSYKRLGGAPFNFSIHTSCFGAPIHFISRIGDDRNGRDIIKKIRSYNFDISGLQIDTDHKTGEVIVDLSNPVDPKYEILKDVAYDYIDFSKEVKKVLGNKIDLFYFGSLIQRGRSGETVKKIYECINKESKIMCDINLRAGCYSEEIIKDSIAYCNILKINNKEIKIVKDCFGNRDNNFDFMRKIIEEHSLDMICLTEGSSGSCIMTKEKCYSARPGKITPIDTVGAGDAFASILAIGILKKWPIKTILERATKFAEDVCLMKGAVPEDISFYDNYKHWIRDV